MAEPGENSKNTELERKPLWIIHVEDEKSFRDLIGVQLGKFPADVSLVESFSSAEEAMRYLQKLRDEKQALPDAVILDNNLGPGNVTGIQFAGNLKREGFNIPLILLTGDSSIISVLSGLPKEILEKQGLIEAIHKDAAVEDPAGSLMKALKSVRKI